MTQLFPTASIRYEMEASYARMIRFTVKKFLAELDEFEILESDEFDLDAFAEKVATDLYDHIFTD